MHTVGVTTGSMHRNGTSFGGKETSRAHGPPVAGLLPISSAEVLPADVPSAAVCRRLARPGFLPHLRSLTATMKQNLSFVKSPICLKGPDGAQRNAVELCGPHYQTQ